jgi:predicted N-acyltransferase
MDYVIRVHTSPLDIPASSWDALLAQQDAPSPIMQHAYLAALHSSGSATPDTGWTPQFVTLWLDEALAAASALYIKATPTANTCSTGHGPTPMPTTA